VYLHTRAGAAAYEAMQAAVQCLSMHDKVGSSVCVVTLEAPLQQISGTVAVLCMPGCYGWNEVCKAVLVCVFVVCVVAWVLRLLAAADGGFAIVGIHCDVLRMGLRALGIQGGHRLGGAARSFTSACVIASLAVAFAA
jgi:hypothetical protein